MPINTRASFYQVSRPETPAQNARSIQATKLAEIRHALFLQAVKEAAVSGVIEPTYDKLADAIKEEFSFKTFERLVGKA